MRCTRTKKPWDLIGLDKRLTNDYLSRSQPLKRPAAGALHLSASRQRLNAETISVVSAAADANDDDDDVVVDDDADEEDNDHHLHSFHSHWPTCIGGTLWLIATRSSMSSVSPALSASIFYQYSALLNPAGGEGVASCPLPRTPPPLSAIGPSVLPPMKNPEHAFAPTMYFAVGLGPSFSSLANIFIAHQHPASNSTMGQLELQSWLDLCPTLLPMRLAGLHSLVCKHKQCPW